MNDWPIQGEGPALKPKGKPLNCRKLPSFRAAWKRCEPGRWRSLRSSVSKWDRPAVSRQERARRRGSTVLQTGQLLLDCLLIWTVEREAQAATTILEMQVVTRNSRKSNCHRRQHNIRVIDHKGRIESTGLVFFLHSNQPN
jgi:hypothetical protein